jgi:hypothetical protein
MSRGVVHSDQPPGDAVILGYPQIPRPGRAWNLRTRLRKATTRNSGKQDIHQGGGSVIDGASTDTALANCVVGRGAARLNACCARAGVASMIIAITMARMNNSRSIAIASGYDILQWYRRSQRYSAGFLFSVYLILAGFERLLIEKIRVNVDLHLLGMAFTQAEAISFVLVLLGFVGVFVTLGKRRIWSRAILSVAVFSALSACAKL